MSFGSELVVGAKVLQKAGLSMLATTEETTVPVTANPLVRQIEAEFPGIFLMTPRRPRDSPNEQFGIWRAGAVHVGDITAQNEFFTAEELQFKVAWVLQHPVRAQ